MRRLTAALSVMLVAPVGASAGVQAPVLPAAETPPGRIGQEIRVVYRYPLEGVVEGEAAQPRLKESPLERGAPLVLRIAGVQTRDEHEIYDLRVIPEIAGEFNVSAFVERTDGGSMRRAPAAWFIVDERLAADHDLELSDDPGLGPRMVAVGGYRGALVAAGVAWAAIPCVALAARLARRRATAAPAAPERPPTTAEQLRPLIEGAAEGVLSVGERARLEMLLIAAYRGQLEGRLALDGLSPEAALARLRRDPDAGAVIAAVERWLHAPSSGGNASAASAAESEDIRRHEAARLLAQFDAPPTMPSPGADMASRHGERGDGR